MEKQTKDNSVSNIGLIVTSGQYIGGVFIVNARAGQTLLPRMTDSTGPP